MTQTKNKFSLIDRRNEIGKWSVSSNELHSRNPIAWRDAIVFSGNKKECKQYMETN